MVCRCFSGVLASIGWAGRVRMHACIHMQQVHHGVPGCNICKPPGYIGGVRMHLGISKLQQLALLLN
jgi:hypothetical protein